MLFSLKHLVLFHFLHFASSADSLCNSQISDFDNFSYKAPNISFPEKKKELDVDVNVTFRLGKQLIAYSHCPDSLLLEIMKNLERSFKNIKDLSQSTSRLTRGQDQVTQPAQHSHMIQGKAHLLSLEVLIP